VLILIALLLLVLVLQTPFGEAIAGGLGLVAAAGAIAVYDHFWPLVRLVVGVPLLVTLWIAITQPRLFWQALRGK
jgi:hypothetical protein